ncbi:carboxypeptidase-like regulatory domain-containing protein [Phosphitispora sp. TUW77]|uniref:carboxypeptidase-like regulatory domain-containing protein n=1 Tax=Phosphitispora sp. TUW77 TaxID=3152361 RepID=UPI003AB29E6F
MRKKSYLALVLTFLMVISQVLPAFAVLNLSVDLSVDPNAAVEFSLPPSNITGAIYSDSPLIGVDAAVYDVYDPMNPTLIHQGPVNIIDGVNGQATWDLPVSEVYFNPGKYMVDVKAANQAGEVNGTQGFFTIIDQVTGPGEDPGTEPPVTVWQNAYIVVEPGFNPVVGETPVLDVVLENFTGDMSCLSAELVYVTQDPVTGDPVSQTIAILDSVVQNDPLSSNYTFSSTAPQLTDPQSNGQWVMVKLIYNDTVSAIFETMMVGNVFIDIMAPGEDPSRQMWVEYDGIEISGQYQGLNRYIVHLEDEFALDYGFSPDNFIVERDTVVVNDVYKAVVPFYDDMQYEGPYQNVCLYLSDVQHGDQLIVQGLTDIAGNQMTAPVALYLDMNVQITGTLTVGGSVIPNAQVIVIPYDSVTGLDVMNSYDFFTNTNGEFFANLPAGTYIAMNAAWMSGDTQEVYYIDMPFEVPAVTTLNLQVPVEPNVNGQVYRPVGMSYTENLVFANTAYLNKDYGEDRMDFLKSCPVAETTGDGIFSLYLPGGEYSLLGKIEGFTVVPPVSPVTITVPDAGTLDISSTEIRFPEHNVSGTIVDSSGNPVPNAFISMFDDAADMMYSASTDQSGNFSLALPDGNYAIGGVMVEPQEMAPEPASTMGLYFLDVAFDVINNQPANVTGGDLALEGTTLSDIVLPSINVEVQLFENGLPVSSDGEICLTMPDGSEACMFGMGTFNFHLNPGTYTFTDLELFGGTYREMLLNEQITVDDLTDYTGANALVFDITTASNVVISFKTSDGSVTGNGYGVSVVKDSGEWFWGEANANGEVYFDLQPGNYRIEGYDVEQFGMYTWQPLNQLFTVGAEHTGDNKLMLTVTVTQPNVSGTVLDEQGAPISWAWVDLEKLPAAGELYSEHFGLQTNETGQFAGTLEDGIYIVKGVGTPDGWLEMNFKFYVITGEVHLAADGSDTVTDFIIQKPAANFSGYLYKAIENEIGVPFAPFEGWIEGPIGVSLLLRDASVDEATFWEAPWLYEKRIDVNLDGSFGTTLQEGKSYALYAICTPKKWIEMDAAANVFTVPAANIIITPPVPNFSGTVRFFDGSTVPMGWLNIEKVDDYSWFGTPVDETGSFGIGLPPGEYVIRDYGYEVNGTSGTEFKRINFNKPLTIPEDGSVVTALRPNLSGSVTVDLSLASGDYASICVKEVISETDSRYDDWMINPWKYESWFELEYDSSSQLAQFMGYLQDGDAVSPKNYQITGISTPNGWKELKESFTLAKGASSANISYNSTYDNYSFGISFSPNVTGVITDDGTPVNDAWVSIERVTDIPSFSDYFGANTDNSGFFSLKLDVGTYRISGYSTPGYWSANTWVPGKWVQLNYQFEVIEGQDVVIDISPNVVGSLQCYDDAGSPVPVSNGWANIKPELPDGSVNWEDWTDSIWVNSDEYGNFGLKLPDGNYRVVDMGGMDFWAKVNISFQVSGSTIFADPVNLVNGKLLVRPAQVNVKGIALNSSGQPVSYGWISIKPADAPEYDWSSAVWAATDAEGKFGISLADGDWVIAEVSAPETWFKVGMPFNVSGTTITSTWVGAVVNNQLQVSEPQANVVGIVKDRSGNVVSGTAWVTIKPATATEFDWESAAWAEYSGETQQFSLFLAEGAYRVTEVGMFDDYYKTNILFNVNASGEIVEVTPGTLANGVLIVSPPAPNVTGTIFDSNGQPIGNGWLGIMRLGTDGSQITLEGQALPADAWFDPNSGISWMYTQWLPSDASGQFALALPAGTYKVISVSGMDCWYQPEYSFIVAEGQTTTLEVNPQAENVTITVTNTGTSDSEAWLEIRTTGDEGEFYIPVKSSTANAGTYTFEVFLKDGDYEVMSFGTPTLWTEVGQQFNVSGSAVVSVDFSVSTKVEVSGTVSSVSEKVWVAIQPVIDGVVDTAAEKKWVQTDETGQFVFKLTIGETWAVTDVSTSAGYTEVADPMANAYTVTSDTAQVGWSINL